MKVDITNEVLKTFSQGKELNDTGVAKMKLDKRIPSHSLIFKSFFLCTTTTELALPLAVANQKWQMTKASLNTSSIPCARCLHQLIETKPERISSRYMAWLAFM